MSTNSITPETNLTASNIVRHMSTFLPIGALSSVRETCRTYAESVIQGLPFRQDRFGILRRVCSLSAVPPTILSAVTRIAQTNLPEPISDSRRDLGMALVGAARYGHIEAVNAIIGSSGFADIPPEALGSALKWAAGCGRIDALNAIIGSNRFKDILPKDLG